MQTKLRPVIGISSAKPQNNITFIDSHMNLIILSRILKVYSTEMLSYEFYFSFSAVNDRVSWKLSDYEEEEREIFYKTLFLINENLCIFLVNMAFPTIKDLNNLKKRKFFNNHGLADSMLFVLDYLSLT